MSEVDEPSTDDFQTDTEGELSLHLDKDETQCPEANSILEKSQREERSQGHLSWIEIKN